MLKSPVSPSFSCLSYTGLYVALLPLWVVFLSSCASMNPERTLKIKGVSLESPARPIDPSTMTDIKSIGSSHVSIMPYAFMKTLDSDSILYNLDWQWWAEREEGVRVLIEQAHDQGIQVMMKPHLWIGHGEYTGDIHHSDPDKLERWKASYEEYILFYAHIAAEMDVSIICIGTELCAMVPGEEAYWKKLVEDIRAFYPGKLTYAANWDCYRDFPWDIGLDFIGIDGYFPLSVPSGADEAQVVAAWEPWKAEMAAYSQEQGLDILFTEFGYRSEVHALDEPWAQHHGGEVSFEIQALGYRSFFKAIWNEPWMAGMFIWKWHTPDHLARKDDTRFSPQGKPALEVIKEGFK
jgi:hypothetical protein